MAKLATVQIAIGSRIGLLESDLQKLYLAEKRSSAEVARILKCSEHKVNYWLLKYNITKRSIAEAVYVHYNPKGDPFHLKEIKTLADAKLFGFGLGLYWGEGSKKSKGMVKLGNTDPKLIKKFIQFLIQICGVKTTKMRFSLQIFSDMHTRKVMQFWFKELREFDILPQQFFKTTITPHRGIGTYREKTKYGVLTVHVCNSKLKALIDSLLPR